MKYNVSMEDIRMVVMNNMKMMSDSSIHVVVLGNGGHLLTETYLDDVLSRQVENIQDKKLIQDIAQDCNLPVQFVMSAITNRIQNGVLNSIKIITLWDGMIQIVTQQYEDKMFCILDELLRNAKEPVKMDFLVKEIELEPIEILNHIRAQCNDKHLGGYLQEDSSSCVAITTLLGAVYVPISYKQQQEEDILAFFRATGYVTVERGEQLGLSRKRLTQVILTQHVSWYHAYHIFYM